MKYEVTYVNEMRETPCCANEGEQRQCNHMEMTRYQTDDLSTCMSLAKDILDVPVAQLTLDQVKEDFSDDHFSDSIQEEKLIAIRDFYNGRLALWNRMKSDINEQSIQKETQFKYDIPEKYNSFCVDEGNQIQSYIEVKSIQQ